MKAEQTEGAYRLVGCPRDGFVASFGMASLETANIVSEARKCQLARLGLGLR